MMKGTPQSGAIWSNGVIIIACVFYGSLLVSAQKKPGENDNRLMHECKGVELDLVEEHALSVDECLASANATSIRDISPSQFSCVGKCVLEKTGLVDEEGHPHKENIFKMIKDILPPEVHDDLQVKFEKCLDEETDLEEQAYQDQQQQQQQQLYCPRTFDGWSCWNETPAGETAYAPCPWFVTGFEAGRIAHKECMKDGSWFKHPLTNSTWSNYTTCVDLEALQVYQNVNLVYEWGYLISVCALILSLFIFCRFRSLSCTRVTIHKHLFASFIINNSLWLVWYRTVVNSGITVNELNQLYCAFIHILTHYFMMANYFWMFCEGFYLHTLLVYAFTRAESKLLRWFYVFGWLGPSIPIGLYTAFRGADGDTLERKECWIHDSKWSLLISGPVCICLLVSLAFLINIVRVLVMKLNASRRVTRTVHGRNNSGRLLADQQQQPQRNGGTSSRRESSAPGSDSASSLRKASRATLILIPLLGLHYFIIPFRPDSETNMWAAIAYEYTAAFTSSLQGLMVSLIFCFCNGEVLAVLRRHICPSSSSHHDSYDDYSCGGKLLGNLARRLFRRNRNNNRNGESSCGDGGGGRGRGGQRQSTFSCSPTTTIVATTTTVVMTLDDNTTDDEDSRLISVTPRKIRNSNAVEEKYGNKDDDGVQLVVIASPKSGSSGRVVVNDHRSVNEDVV